MFKSVEYLDKDKEKVTEITRVGKVLITFANNDTFEGFYDNTPKGLVRHGLGIYTWKSGAVYEGDYNNGKREGHGIYRFSGGEVYEGAWVDGVKAGKGVYTYANGDEFHGEWVGDKRNGPGKFYSKLDKTIVSGEWKNGHLLEETSKREPYVEPQPSAPKEAEKEEPVTKDVDENSPPEEINNIEELKESVQEELKKNGMVVVISGPPASGKGTQCKRIVDGFGVVHLSTGDMLREAVSQKTELGLKAHEFMTKGELVPDELVNGIIKERLQQPDVKEKGVLLDGYPRTAAQAKELQNMGIEVDACVLLEVPDDIVIDRAVGRRLDPVTGHIYHMTFNPPPEGDMEIINRLEHRKDDNKEAMEQRLVQYGKNVGHLKEHYDSKLMLVDGNRRPSIVWNNVKEILEEVEKGTFGESDTLEAEVKDTKKEEEKKKKKDKKDKKKKNKDGKDDASDVSSDDDSVADKIEEDIKEKLEGATETALAGTAALAVGGAILEATKESSEEVDKDVATLDKQEDKAESGEGDFSIQIIQPVPEPVLYPVEEANEETPVEETKEETPVEEVKEEAAVEETKEETPVEEVKEEAAVEETKEETPVEEVKEKAAVEETKEETPVEETKEEAPVEEPTVEQPPVEEATVEE